MKKDRIRIDGTPWHAGQLQSAFESASVRTAALGIAILGGFAVFQTHSHSWWSETAITGTSMALVAVAGWWGRKLEIDMCKLFHNKAACKGILPDARKNFPEEESDQFLDSIRDMRVRCHNEIVESSVRLIAGIPAGALAAASVSWNFTAFSLMPTLISLPGLVRGITLHRRCSRIINDAQAASGALQMPFEPSP